MGQRVNGPVENAMQIQKNHNIKNIQHDTISSYNALNTTCHWTTDVARTYCSHAQNKMTLLERLVAFVY